MTTLFNKSILLIVLSIISNLIVAQTIYVDDYGAVGDGVTDDYIPIETAIIDLGANGGELVFTSGKTYIISEGLLFNAFPDSHNYLVRTSGGAKATIKIEDGAPLTWNHWVIRLSESKNVTIQNFIVDGNRDTRNPTVETSGTDVIFIDGASNGTRLYDMDIINSPMDNIYIVVHENQNQTLMTDFEMHNCKVENGFRNNMSIISGANFKIIGCEFNNANGTDPQSGIDFEPNQSSAAGYSNITVEGCKFKNNVRYGIELTYVIAGSGSNTIKNNYFENNGILIGSPDNVIHNNIFAKQDHQHLHGDETRDGIIYFHANGNGKNNKVYNNYFYDNPMPAGSHLVNFMYNSGGNNHLYDNFAHGNSVSSFVINNTNPATPSQIISNNIFLSRKEMGFWSMDSSDISGTNINDLSDFNNDGTLVNSPLSVTGKVNEALDFSPDDKHIEVDTSNSLNIEINITLSAWIKWYGVNSSEPEQVFLGRGDDWRFGINNSGQLGFYSAHSSDTSFTAGWVQTAAADSITVNQWKFVTFTYDGRVAKLYVDTVEVANKQANGDLGTSSAKLFLGSLIDDSCSFNGVIDEAKIYNYALSQQQIEQSMGINYYVDFTLGNDSNMGTRPATAFKTINKINSLSFHPGDSILFKRGEVWKGTRLYIENIEGSSNAGIVYGAYGTGAKPVISTVVNQQHTWTNIGGNIWQATNPPAANPERMLIDSIEKLRANIQSELDGIKYFWRYDDDTNDLYLYSTTDPNGVLDIEYATDFPIIVGYSNYVTISNLDVQGGWTGVFINTMSKNITLDSMNIGKYCRNGVIVNTDSDSTSEYPENILVKNCDFDAHFAFDYSTAGSYQGSFDRGCDDGIRLAAINGGEIGNCHFTNWGHAGINLDGSSGIKASNVSVHNNFLTSPDICYGGRLAVDNAVQNEIYDNQIFHTSVQSQLNGQNNHYHHNIFNGTTNTPLKPDIVDAGIELQGYANMQVQQNIYENNIILNTEGPGFRISGNNSHDIHDNIIRNNIIYNCGSSVAGKSLVVETDEYEATYDNSFMNNSIFNDSTTHTCDFRGSIYDVAGFNALTGTDGYIITNNIPGDPLFVDTANNNYHLLNNSPCIDSGTGTLSTSDFDGTPIPLLAKPDIGAFEYGTYWNGTISYLWQTAGNWSNNQVPAATDSVTIPSPRFYHYNPRVNTNIQVKKLFLNSGGKVEVKDNARFEVLP